MNKYKRYLFNYGIISIILVLEHFEQEENFEECQKIMECIEYFNNLLDIKLDTKITDKCYSEVIETYKSMGLTGERVYENSVEASKIIIRDVIAG